MKKLIHLAVLFAFFGCLPVTGYAQDPGFGLQANVDQGIVEAVKSNIENTLGQQWQFVSSANESDGVISLYFETRLGSKKRVMSIQLVFMQSLTDAQIRFNLFQEQFSRRPPHSEIEGVGEEARIWHNSLPETCVISRQNSVFIYAWVEGAGETRQREIIEFTSVVAQAIANVK